MKNFIVIGNPIDHSYSPLIHNANFKALNLHDYSYEKVLVEDISQMQQVITDRNVIGLNATLPWKEKIIQYLDKIYLPNNINAVNTIRIEDNKMIGYNTDIYGILEDFREKQIRLEKKKILILGYGGLGRTLAQVFRTKGSVDVFVSEYECISRNLNIFDVKVANRTIKDGVDIQANSQEMLNMIVDYDVVINTTKIGSLDIPKLSLDDCKRFNGCFYDCTPKQTEIVQRIKKQTNGKSYDGLGMLVHQGAKSFQIWTKKNANIIAMKKALNIA